MQKSYALPPGEWNHYLVEMVCISVEVQQQLHLLPVLCRRIHPDVCLCHHMAVIEHSTPIALPAPIAYNQT